MTSRTHQGECTSGPSVNRPMSASIASNTNAADEPKSGDSPKALTSAAPPRRTTAPPTRKTARAVRRLPETRRATNWARTRTASTMTAATSTNPIAASTTCSPSAMVISRLISGITSHQITSTHQAARSLRRSATPSTNRSAA